MTKESNLIRNTFYAQFSASLVSEMIHTLGPVIDGIIVGHFLGVHSMAAFGIISPILVVYSLAGAVISVGSRNRFTRLIGEGKIKKAQGVFSLSLLVSVGAATFIMVVILIFSGSVAALMGASRHAARLLPQARAYLIGISIGLPAMNAMRILNNYLPIDNDRALPGIASIVMVATDIVMDLLVVLVLHGGTFGMGLATSISNYAALFVLLTHFRKKERILKLHLKGIPWEELPGIIFQGAPVGLCRIGCTLRCAFMNHLLSIIAAASAIAAYSVYQQAEDIFNCLPLSMANTAAMIAGILAGEEDRPALKRLLRASMHASFFFTMLTAAATWSLAPHFSSLYIGSDASALRYSIVAVRAYALGTILYGINVIYQNYMQGIGKTILSSTTGFMSEAGFLILSAWIMSYRFGPHAVWLAFPVTQILMLAFYSIAITINSIKLHLQHRGLWDRILMLPLSFDVPDRDRIDVSINSIEEVNNLSDKVWDFCETHGCDADRTYYLSLATEEAAGNIIKHGFTADKKSGHSIDVRVIKKEEDYILRIRDDCTIFDPTLQLQLFSEEDKLHHMGLRLIFQFSRDVRYICIMKLNNLLVRV